MILLKGKEGLPHVVGKDIQNVFQNLFKQRGKWRREVRKYVEKYYTDDAPTIGDAPKTVVFMADGRMHHGGLCDRLKGIVSVYSVCKAMGLRFKIHFVSPFCLEEFLVPNEVDWRISPEELSYNKAEALPLFCGTNGTHVEMPFQRRWFVKNFKRDFRQFHVYTNADLVGKDRYGTLFRELFSLSPDLDAAVKAVKEEIGDKYIAIVCRFQQLLGDFVEGNYEVLSAENQEYLMDKAFAEIEKIYRSQRVQLPVLLTSESVRFLDYATRRAPYIHRVPGELVHMDWSNNGESRLHLKSFADLIALSGAESIYLLKSPKMYNSGFPRIAAKIGGKPFKLVRFMYE